MTMHMQREIEKLKKLVLSLGAEVEENVHKAVQALEARDKDLAGKIIAADAAVDKFEVYLEEECLKILALHQPVAIDLRFVIAVLKINNDLERIGDLAVNIAERAMYLSSQEPVDVPFDFVGMAAKTKLMLKRSLDALVNMDSREAQEVCAMDDDVDAMNRLGKARYYEGAPPLFGIGPDFVKYSMEGTFDDTLIVMMGCDGLRSQRTAEAFLDRGAGAFVSWSKPVSSSHTDAATERLLERLLIERLPTAEAVRQTAEEIGPDPIYEGELRVLESDG